jgi:alpha-beta hydrolase superfamily lysophospholipase
MLSTLHWLIIAAYIVAPIVATAYAVSEATHQRARAAARLFVSVLIGSFLGIGATIGNAFLNRGHVGPWQFFLAIYFATSMMLVLNVFDALVRRLSIWFSDRLERLSGSESEQPSALRRGLASFGQMFIASLRVVVLIAVGLPYMLSVAATYRPKVTTVGDPRSVLGYGYTEVQFRSTDGLRLAGWWIPASRRPPRGPAASRPADFGNKTVILCHGFAADKATQLSLVRDLLPAGYNVLAFDFRAHGQSAGQLTSLGDLERRDVLGAVRWLRETHPNQSKKIVGVGATMGAAALIAAAADPSDEGNAIEAIAVYDAYDDLGSLALDLSRQTFASPMDWIMRYVGLPFASLQTGTNLSNFKPASLISRLWPRPVLVIHGTHDSFVDFARGSSLFDAATQPKRRLWLLGQDERHTVQDEGAAETVRDFFDTARPRQII